MKTCANMYFQIFYSCMLINLLFMQIALSMVKRGNRLVFTDDEKKDIMEFVQETVACRNISGLTLAVVDKDKTLFAEGFGDADKEKGEKVTTDTLFPIASTSKAFTATLLAMILTSKKHRFSWDTPIFEILGNDFQLYDDTLTYQTTLTDLLSHRTGLPGLFVMISAGNDRNQTRADLVRSLRYHKPDFPLRTKFIYNNYMYTLAGYVAEVLEKKSWEDLVRERILHPLQMTATGFIPDDGMLEKIARSYTYVDGAFVPVDLRPLHIADITGPSGSMVSTANDMSKWLQFHLNSGLTPSGSRIISPDALEETYSELVTPFTPIDRRALSRPEFPISDIYVSYNMGWMTAYYRGHKRVWHSGGITTYKSQVWLYPDLGFGLYVSSNGPPTSRASWALILILQYISDILLEEPHWLNTTTACTFPEPWTTPKEKDPSDPGPPDDTLGKPYSDYIGKYSNVAFGDVFIAFNSTSKRLTLEMGLYVTAELYYEKEEDKFRTKGTGFYWYTNDILYMKFKHSLPGGEIDKLVYLLDTQYGTTSQVEFTRGTAAPTEGSNINGEGPCTSQAEKQTVYLSRWLCVQFFLLLLFLSLN